MHFIGQMNDTKENVCEREKSEWVRKEAARAKETLCQSAAKPDHRCNYAIIQLYHLSLQPLS